MLLFYAGTDLLSQNFDNSVSVQFYKHTISLNYTDGSLSKDAFEYVCFNHIQSKKSLKIARAEALNNFVDVASVIRPDTLYFGTLSPHFKYISLGLCIHICKQES